MISVNLKKYDSTQLIEDKHTITGLIIKSLYFICLYFINTLATKGFDNNFNHEYPM